MLRHLHRLLALSAVVVACAGFAPATAEAQWGYGYSPSPYGYSPYGYGVSGFGPGAFDYGSVDDPLDYTYDYGLYDSNVYDDFYEPYGVGIDDYGLGDVYEGFGTYGGYGYYDTGLGDDWFYDYYDYGVYDGLF